MGSNNYSHLRVYLDDKTSDKYTGYYNNSFMLWRYIEDEVSKDDRERLGLYKPDFHALNSDDGKYVETYTIGDLIHFLNYNYYFPTLKNQDGSHIFSHRRLSIMPVPIDKLDYLSGEREMESEVTNDRSDYIWRIMIGNEVLGQDTELVYALYKAVNKVYLKEKLYKIALNDGDNVKVPQTNIEETETDEEITYYDDTDKRFLNVNSSSLLWQAIESELPQNDIRILGVYEANYRTKYLTSGKQGVNYQMYDVGDLISFLFYDYYQQIQSPKTYRLHNRLTINPVPVDRLSGGAYTSNTNNDRSLYEWVIQIGANIIGKNVNLIDALEQAVYVVYTNKQKGTNELIYPDKLYKIVRDEIQLNTNQQNTIEFSLTDV